MSNEKFNQDIVLAVHVIIVSNDKILLLRRSNTAPSRPLGWDLPGGVVEEGEDPYVTALRETDEEAGIKLESAEIIHLKMRPSTSFDGNSLQMFFRASTDTHDVKLSFEHDKFKWVTIVDALETDLPPAYIEALKKI